MTADSKLHARLTDPLRSGAYRVSSDRDIRDALGAGDVDLVPVALGAGKDKMLAAIAKSLGFPEWFGGNWDALEDSLTDLSWREDRARVLLISGAKAGDELGILLDVLASAAEYWRERERAFFAVFVDPKGKLELPALYREKAG